MIPNDRPYLIGETAFHHMGDLDFLKELINKADDLNLNAIKFHLLLDPDDYMVSNHKAITTIKKWCFSKDQWKEIARFASSKELDLIFLCNDVKSIQWVRSLNFDVEAIEIHATGINDYFLLQELAKFSETVMLGTGGSTLDEVQYAVDILKKLGKKDLFLMHGFQNYPTDPADIRLSRMNILNNIFNLPVGYADHSNPNDKNNEMISVFAASMGFNVLEKHFTHEFGVERIDSQSAVSIDQMRSIKKLHAIAWNAYGEDPLEMSDAEKKYGETGPMKKAIVARNDIEKGEIINSNDIAFKRTNESSSIFQREFPNIIGLKTKEKIFKDEIIDYSNVKFEFQKNNFEEFNK